MLGADIASVGWPQSGEIDIMENIGREPAILHGTLHGPGYSGADGISRADTLSSGAWADDFHVFAVSWRPNEIRWFVDGRQYHRLTPTDLPSGTKWVFDHAFFLLLNVAVGGAWPGDPDPSTTFPQQMVVDYVRVYREP
jgi:beta-glucanase (GH16 family)